MKRRKFIVNSSLGIMATLPALDQLAALDLPYFTTGIKIGEVGSTSAVVWARLTKEPIRVPDRGKLPKFLYLDEANNEWHDIPYFKSKYKEDRPDRKVKIIMPEGSMVDNLDGAVPGKRGSIHIQYRIKDSSTWQKTKAIEVDESTDFTCQFLLENLSPNTPYEINIIGKKNQASQEITGSFKTAAHIEDAIPVNFMVTTCHEYNDRDLPGDAGFKIFNEMEKLKPDFLVHTGDVLYHDHYAKNLALARWNWQRMNSLRGNIGFYRNTPCYFMKDDHDCWMNDCHPASNNKFMGEFTFQQGVELFRQQVPSSEKPYRTFQWGKDVQIWMFDVREFRKPNEMPDGPDKTIWGAEQINWFKCTYKDSTATFKVLISPTPILGPDRPQKKDNHSNSNFSFEGDMIRNFIAGHPNTFFVCGDRHWQYVSKHAKTGSYEFACGPASNEHAGGWKKEDIYPEHEYLNIVGGFLRIEVGRTETNPIITFSHYSVDGKILFQKKFIANGYLNSFP
ncbi:MAG: hypothetical protein RL282_380 [Bacteroidota bacterium]|jgi:alkaline phosphatase D